MSGKNKQDKNQNPVVYSELAIRNNLSVVEYCRTSMAALSGCTAGSYVQIYLPSINWISIHFCRLARFNWSLWCSILYIRRYESMVYGINESWFF